MNPRSLFFLLGIFTLLNLHSQNMSIGEIDKHVELTRQHIEELEEVKRFDTDTAKRTLYFKGKELKVVAVRGKSDKIEKSVQWYFHKRSLLYTETNWSDSTTGRQLFTERTYHNNGDLIAWINSENSFVDSSSPEFNKLDRELRAYATQIRDEAEK